MKNSFFTGCLMAVLMGGAGLAEGRIDPREAPANVPTALEQNAQFQWTPLHWAVRRGDIDKVRDLASQGNLETRDFQGRTPLHIAILSGHDDLVALLINRGANVNAQDQWDITPLMRVHLIQEIRGWDRKNIANLLRNAGAYKANMTGRLDEKPEASEAPVPMEKSEAAKLK